MTQITAAHPQSGVCRFFGSMPCAVEARAHAQVAFFRAVCYNYFTEIFIPRRLPTVNREDAAMTKKKKNKYTVNILWKDRRRRLGMPLSFQRYRLGEDRLFYEKGFLNTSVDDILLYRVRDIGVKISFWQRFTGVGTVTVNSSDQTMPVLVMRDIKHPRDVKEMLHQQVEKAKIAYRVRYNEMMGAAGDANGDGIPDVLQDENFDA